MCTPCTITFPYFRGNLKDLALLALVVAGDNDDGIAGLYMNLLYHLRSSLKYFGCEGKNLRVLVIAELACNGSEDTGSLRIFVFSDDDRCVLVELNVGTVASSDALHRS